MFDHNAMHELAHLKAERYARNGGGGGFKVATSTKAYYEARTAGMSAFQSAAYEAREAFQIAARGAVSDFRNAANAFDLIACERKDAARVALATIPF